MYTDVKSTNFNKILTISVAAYNVEKTIVETLDSLTNWVPADTLGKLEILVVNDGSKDSTKEVVAKYEEQYPDSVILISKENAGWGSTVNTSISFAKGKYLKLLDGDDWFQTENLPEFIDFLEKAEADIVLAPYIKRFPDRDELQDEHKEISEQIFGIENLNPDIDIYMHEIAVRTERLREGKVSITERCFYTDNEFAFEAIKWSETVQRFKKPIYIYRLGDSEQSVGLAGILKHYKDTVSVAEKMYESYGRKEERKEHPTKDRKEDHSEDRKENRKNIDEPADLKKDRTEDRKSITEIKDRILRRKLLIITDSLYVSYLLVNSREAKKELIRFDRKLKKRPEIYRITGENKKIKSLRLTGFILYGYLAGKVRARFG